MPVTLVVDLIDSVRAVEELGEDYSIDVPPAEMDVLTPFALLKADTDALVIAGYASPYIVDSENHRIGIGALQDALKKFMANKAYRNVQILHSNVQVGRVVDSATDSKGRVWKTHVDDKGLFAVAVIDRGDLEVGAKVIEKIRDDTLDSWSIAGRALASKYICENKTCFYDVTKLELYELTVCERGKNLAAKFDVLKADGLSYSSLMDQGTAEVKSSGKEIGEEIQLADVLQYFGKPVMVLREFVTLVGGLPSRGATKGDIDLLIKKDREEMTDIPIQFRLIRSIDPELWDRVHWSYDAFHGPFTNFVPLYDLWLVPSERSGEVIRMAENPDTELVAVTKAGKEKAGPGPGWHGPPKGTHAAGKWDKKSASETLSAVKKWEGDRSSYAQAACYRMIDNQANPSWDGLVLKDKNEIVGVASVKITPKYLEVDRLATKRPGHGRALVHQIRVRAKEKGLGVRLTSIPAAEGFYKKLGMHQDGELFSWEAEELKKADLSRLALENEVEMRKDWDDEIRPEDEPKSGIFTEPLADERSDEKKVTALAELQNAVIELAARPGQGMGVGKPSQAAGGRIACVCPDCGLKVDKDRGRPCTSLKCPECGSQLTGFPLEKTSSIYEMPESDWSSCGDDGNSDRD